jgi:hypothetical protein
LSGGAKLADYYIFIPCIYYDREVLENYESESSEDILLFINNLKEDFEYECSSEISHDLNRKHLGKCNILSIGDEYSKESINNASETINAEIIVTYHLKSPLCIVTLVVSNTMTDLTFLQDNMATNNLYLLLENNIRIEMSAFLKNYFRIRKIGDSRSLICIDKMPDYHSMIVLLAGEAAKSNVVSYQLKDYSYKEKIIDNFAQYDFYEIYASTSSVVYILPNMKNEYLANTLYEIALLFILELVLFQYAATCYAETLILEGLESVKLLTLKDIENIYEKFGKTIRFWNKNNFKYLTVQHLADKIEKIFQIEQLRKDYYQNLAHLEHIVQLRSSQNSEKEGKIINFIAIFITVIQFIPMVIEFFSANENWDVVLLRGSAFTIPVVVILLLLNYRRKLQRRKNNSI